MLYKKKNNNMKVMERLLSFLYPHGSPRVQPATSHASVGNSSALVAHKMDKP